MAQPVNKILLVDDDKMTNLMHIRQIVKFELAASVGHQHAADERVRILG